MMDGQDNLTSKFGQDLAYDLRQYYAKIVGEQLAEVSEARKADNFYVYFKTLEDLHTIIKHKFKHEKEDEAAYNNKVKEITKLANASPNAWGGRDKGEKYAEIENALRDIEMFLYKKMNDAKMFGTSGRVEGL